MEERERSHDDYACSDFSAKGMLNASKWEI